KLKEESVMRRLLKFVSVPALALSVGAASVADAADVPRGPALAPPVRATAAASPTAKAPQKRGPTVGNLGGTGGRSASAPVLKETPSPNRASIRPQNLRFPIR